MTLTAKRLAVISLSTFLPVLDAHRPASLLPLWLESSSVSHNKPKAPLLRRTNSLDDRQLHDIAEASCSIAAQENEDALVDIGLECHCKPRDEGVLLMCMDECAYCNDAQTVCGVQSAQSLYDNETGERIALGGVFEYVTGFHDTLGVENVGCVEQAGAIVSCESCNVYVNGEECNSCEIQICESGFQAEIIDCENIESGALFNFCEDVNIGEDSVFTALSTNEFEDCLPLDVLGLGKSSKKGSERGKGKGGKGKGGKGKGGKGKGGSGSSRSGKGSKKGSSNDHHEAEHSIGKGGSGDSHDFEHEDGTSKSAKKAQSRRKRNLAQDIRL